MDCVWITFITALLLPLTQQYKCPALCMKPLRNSSICAKWPESPFGSLVISNPPCYDSSGKFILRECVNGTWFPRNLCHHVKRNNCARGVMQLGPYCAIITGKQTFQAKCPQNMYKYYNISRVTTKVPLWAPIHRIDNTFVYTAHDRLYGKEFKAPLLQKDCFVTVDKEIVPVFCNESHYQLCVYNCTNFNTQNGLQLRKSSELQTVETNKVRLELKFDKKREKIILTVYSPQLVMMMLDTEEYAIYCFTDAAITQIKSPIRKKAILIKNDVHVYQVPIHFDNPGQYWCEAVDYQENTIRTKQLVAYRKKKGHEYSLRLILFDICDSLNLQDCSAFTPDLIIKHLDKIKFKDTFKSTNLVVRVMEVVSLINYVDADVILHLTTLHKANVIGEYYMLQRMLHQSSIPMEINWFRSSEICLPDNKGNLTWKMAGLGTKTMPREICMDANNAPVTRKCSGGFLEGAYWGPLTTTCNPNFTITPKTELLYKIITCNITTNVTGKIMNLTTDPTDMVPLDVYFIANTLNNLTVDEKVLDNVAQTVQNMLIANSSMLKQAQIELNATDTILDSIEKILQENSILERENIIEMISRGEVFTLIKENFLIQITRPFLSGVNGLAIYDYNIDNKFQPSEIENIYFNQTFDDLDLQFLDLAFFVPESLLDSLLQREIVDEDENNITLITTVFFNDKLFNSEREDLGKPNSKVISIKIPDFGIFLEEPIPLLFRNGNDSNDSTTKDSQCAFWDYGEDSPNNQTGYWSTIGGLTDKTNQSLSYCSFSHLTHFALLILSQTLLVAEVDVTFGEVDNEGQENIHDIILSAITIIGCTLSLLGLFGIFLTAICFKRWRQKTGTKILLQLSVTITLEIIIVHIADSDFLPDRTLACNLVGLCLHYVVVAKFFWMFVSAILQYLRFVQVFTVLPKRWMLKAMLFAWCLPLVPVSLVGGLLPNSYSHGAQKFCYPSGLGLYLGLFMPIALIVTANLVVFTLIMQNVWDSKMVDRHKSQPTNCKLQIYLGILLFFMLGIPWVFGISAEIFRHSPLQLVFVYLFCLTATLQGCVIFVFYVIVDKETRLLWVQAFQQNNFRT